MANVGKMVWVSAGQWPEHWAVCLGRWEFSAGHRRPVGTLSLEASTLGFPPSLPAHPRAEPWVAAKYLGRLAAALFVIKDTWWPNNEPDEEEAHLPGESSRTEWSPSATWGFREWTRPSADPRRGEARRALVPCRPRSGRCPLWWTRGAVCVQVSGKDSRIQVIGEMKPG